MVIYVCFISLDNFVLPSALSGIWPICIETRIGMICCLSNYCIFAVTWCIWGLDSILRCIILLLDGSRTAQFLLHSAVCIYIDDDVRVEQSGLSHPTVSIYPTESRKWCPINVISW
jgi:hypothetical protein